MAWLSGWSYRKEISITGQSGAGTDFQVDFDIGDSAGGDFHLEGNCTNFPQDIEVTDNDGTTLLDFWIEDITTDPLKMWVEVADDLGSNQTIYVYYGKSGATTNSDIGATFIFGDDFNDASFDTSKWTKTEVGSGTITEADGLLTAYSGEASGNRAYVLSDVNINYTTIIEYNASLPAAGGSYEEAGVGHYYLSATDDMITFLDASTANSSWYLNSKKNGTAGTSTQVTGDADYHDFKIIWESTQIRWYIDTVLRKTQSDTAYIPTDATPLGFGSQYGNASGHGYLNYIYVRKYAATEPAFSSAGSEETSPTGVKIPVLMHHYNQMMRA